MVSGVFLALAAYVVAAALVLRRIGFWDTAVLKDTIFWFVTVACASVFRAAGGAESRRMFRDLVRDSFAITAILVFFVNSFVFSLPAEMILVPAATLLVLVTAVVEGSREYRSLRPVFRALSGGVGLAFVAVTIQRLLPSVGEFASWQHAREFLLEPILTLCVIPFFLLFANVCEYGKQFVLIDHWLKGKPRLARFAKWRMILSAWLSLKKLEKLRGDFYLRIEEAPDKETIAGVIREFVSRREPKSLPGRLVNTRLEPFQMASTGKPATMVLVDWQNTSDRSVESAYADIEPFDADDEPLPFGAKDYCIFHACGDPGFCTRTTAFNPRSTSFPSPASSAAEAADAW